MPLLAAHRYNEDALWWKTTLAFVAFGCCASAGYILNDLLDLPADRHHPQKRFRAFASGETSALLRLRDDPGSRWAWLPDRSWVSPLFLLFAMTYFALSVTYSLY